MPSPSESGAPPQGEAGDRLLGEGVERGLDPRVIPLQQAVGLIVAILLAAASFVALIGVWAANRFSLILLLVLGPLWLVASALLTWYSQGWPAIEYRHTSYRVDADGIEIRRGVFWRTVTNVPRSRVQHTDVAQGPMERKYGLGTLVIYTAGTDHARVALGGLDHAHALAIRGHLLPTERSDAV